MITSVLYVFAMYRQVIAGDYWRQKVYAYIVVFQLYILLHN
jgi:hypothetical protein